MGLWTGSPASQVLLGPDAPRLGTKRGPADTQSGAVRFPEGLGRHLPDRLRVTLDSDLRLGRQRRYPAGEAGNGLYA